MPRGGERQGVPGAQYPQRSDLQANPRTGGKPSTYGNAKRQSQVSATPDAKQYTGPPPGSLIPLDAPSERPDEPVTAGLDIGAGPGSEVLAARPVQDDALFHLRAVLAEYPEYAASLSRLIALAEEDL
jgi:hypothetical protein